MKVTKSTVHTLDTGSEVDNICIMSRQWKRYIRFLLGLALRVCQIGQLYRYLPNANTCDLTTVGWLLWAGYRGLATVGWLPWAGYRGLATVRCNTAGVGLLG